MAENKKLTVYQKLSKVLTADGIKQSDPLINKYSIDSSQLLTTTSKEEFELAKKQAQQTKFLGNLWKKVDNNMFQKTIHYETSRIASYSDFEQMEFYPIISAALDIIAEESTTVNANGRMLNVYSDSDRVKKVLNDLFYNRLNITTSLPMWTRNTAKYGDNFVLLKMDDKLGVVSCKQLPNFEIERREGDVAAYLRSDVNGGDNQIKFFWKGTDIEFNSWQIAHFRLLGDDRRLPYGTSIIEKARAIWKRLILAEDSMLVYRVTRAPERRVFKIYVGNIDDEDVEAYVNAIADRFKRTPVIDPSTGQVNLQMNQLGIDQDYFIPTRDENAPTPIDTLPGAANMGEISDIEYLRDNLFTAIRVPKPFLGFDAANGEGKNLALQDIRFARTINRVQQSMLQELNKIAIIHLYLLGLEDELNNFTLTLNNPSTQAEMLKIEHIQQKINAYKTAVEDAGNGFGALSMTRAKKEILGMSPDEIKQDLLEQRMEKAASEELKNTNSVIKHTGVFDKVDKIYGDINVARKGGLSDEDGEEGDTPSGGGSFGGGSFGGGMDFAGDEDLGDMGDFSEEGDEGDTGEGVGEPEDIETIEEPTGESIKGIPKDKLILEKKSNFNKYLDDMLFKEHTDKILDINILTDKTFKINENLNSLINELDKKLKEK
jgi:uncharacterized membrane protein YgcG